MPTVPFRIAGKTVMVTKEQFERLTSPRGWGDLSVEELAELGIQPGMSGPGKSPPTGGFTPNKG